MSLWEFQTYIHERDLSTYSNNVSFAWKIINFLSLLLSGKLKDLKEYLPKEESKKYKSVREDNIKMAIERAKELHHKF